MSRLWVSGAIFHWHAQDGPHGRPDVGSHEGRSTLRGRQGQPPRFFRHDPTPETPQPASATILGHSHSGWLRCVPWGGPPFFVGTFRGKNGSTRTWRAPGEKLAACKGSLAQHTDSHGSMAKCRRERRDSTFVCVCVRNLGGQSFEVQLWLSPEFMAVSFTGHSRAPEQS